MAHTQRCVCDAYLQPSGVRKGGCAQLNLCHKKPWNSGLSAGHLGKVLGITDRLYINLILRGAGNSVHQ